MKYRKVGQTAGTFGIKGEFKVISHTDFPNERFKVGNEIYGYINNEYILFHVRSYRVIKGRVHVSFEEIPTLTEAEEYKDMALFIDADSKRLLKEGTYYPDEIIGLDVYQGDKYLGKVVDVDFLSVHPVIRVELENNSILIPYVKAFIKEVNIDKGIINIDEKEGLG